MHVIQFARFFCFLFFCSSVQYIIYKDNDIINIDRSGGDKTPTCHCHMSTTTRADDSGRLLLWWWCWWLPPIDQIIIVEIDRKSVEMNAISFIYVKILSFSKKYRIEVLEAKWTKYKITIVWLSAFCFLTFFAAGCLCSGKTDGMFSSKPSSIRLLEEINDVKLLIDEMIDWFYVPVLSRLWKGTWRRVHIEGNTFLTDSMNRFCAHMQMNTALLWHIKVLL